MHMLGFPGGVVVKNPAGRGDTGDLALIPRWEGFSGGGPGNSLHSSSCWEIPWIEEPGGLQSMGLQRVRHNLVTKEQQQCMY